MAKNRILPEELLFPGESEGQRQRHMRFFALAVTLGMFLCVAIGVILYTINVQGRI